jgi:hypothetical protein
LQYHIDPLRQIDFIKQCLSSDKKPLGLLLGAGCPMAVKPKGEGNPPLIPDIAGITKYVCEQLSKCKDCGPLLKIVEGNFRKDNVDADCEDILTHVNIEQILTHIRALRMVAGNDVVRGLSATNLDNLDNRICQIIYDLVNKELPNSDTPYHHVAAWVDSIGRENPVEIFTTNYDLLMEQALEDCRVPYFDGFAGSRKPFFDIRAIEVDKLPARWGRLWKLHGSINWYQPEEKGVLRGGTNEKGMKRIIHPSHLKYDESRRMPYLAMSDRLSAFLRQSTAALIICGYSFRDQHINDVIRQGLQNSQNSMAFALLFDEIAKYSDACDLAKQRSNLTCLAMDGGIISGRKVKWPEIKAESFSSGGSRKWITYTPIKASVGDEKLVPNFRLGDFAFFGQFLYELIGDVRQTRETSIGK